jgi:hypothetical protein
MALSIEIAISEFGREARSKLSNPAATGQPEDQLRAPFEQLLKDVATLIRDSAKRSGLDRRTFRMA